MICLMQTYSPSDIRNFAIVGHASCGKTMLSEAMLSCSGAVGRMGRIVDGSTVSDYHASESWTWEHMALTRARVVAGPAPLAKRIEAEIHRRLTAKPDRTRIFTDARAMFCKVTA